MPGLRVLTLAPSVWEQPGQLHARTSAALRVLTLGSYSRHVVVDRQARWLTITHRRLWLTQRRSIPFRHVHRIEYDFHRVVTSLAAHYGRVRSGDELESFKVSVVLRTRENVPASHAHLDEEHVPLFVFLGEGRGVRLIDFEGSQERLSHQYVERLREYLGVGIGLGTPQLSDQRGRTWTCSSCKRAGPPRPGRCYYCGGELVVAHEP